MPKKPVLRVVALAVVLSLGGAFAAPAFGAAKRAGQASQTAQNAVFDKWAERFAADWVRGNPEQSTSAQYFAGVEQQRLDGMLTQVTDAQRAAKLALARSGVDKVERFLAGPLSETQRTSAETMRWSLKQAIADAPYREHSFAFSQLDGAQVSIVSFMSSVQPLRRAADVDSYLSRLGKVAALMDQVTRDARRAAARQLLPPRFILERAQTQVDTFLAPAPDKNVLVTSFATRLATVPDLSPEERAAAVARAAGIVGADIVPAFGRVKVFLAEIHPRTTDQSGLSRMPDGAAAYRQALAKYTGTTLSADAIHTIGLREVARIEKEMDGHLRTLGFSEGSIAQRFRALNKSLQPKGDVDPRPAILQRYQDMIVDAQKRSEPLFNLKPRAGVEVKREPALTEASSSAHYSVPAPDGSKPGVFWVPLPGPEFRVVDMKSLAVHEAVPGHHFQLAVQQELTGLPKFRTSRIFGGGSAHSEGWALYAERLAVEQGWYEGDLHGLVGALSTELFRARRLVVDTGLHAKGWTRQQAIDYGIEAKEVERYIARPGQACAYMLGMLRILELREQAKAALGDKFSLPGFHDVVLKTGSVPLDVLAKVVEQWIAGQQPGARKGS